MFESLFSSYDTDNLFDEFRRLENEMVQLFGHSPWPAGIRALERGTFPPLNVGATPERVDVYLFAANLEPKSLDLSIQQNLDRKSTRLNSSHSQISYAVFCLKKKKKKTDITLIQFYVHIVGYNLQRMIMS